MDTLFLICATLGGTILVVQLVLALLGMGGDVAGEIAGDLGDVPDIDLPDSADGGGEVGHAGGGLSELGRKISLQAIIAFTTFFGVGGLAARGFDLGTAASLAVALGVGVASMALLIWAFGLLGKLQNSGSLRLSNAVGQVGKVYLRVPADHSGAGKVTVPVQGRTEEVRAVTPGPELRLGEPVVVTRVVDVRTLEVVAEAAHVDKSASLAE